MCICSMAQWEGLPTRNQSLVSSSHVKGWHCFLLSKKLIAYLVLVGSWNEFKLAIKAAELNITYKEQTRGSS